MVDLPDSPAPNFVKQKKKIIDENDYFHFDIFKM